MSFPSPPASATPPAEPSRPPSPRPPPPPPPPMNTIDWQRGRETVQQFFTVPAEESTDDSALARVAQFTQHWSDFAAVPSRPSPRPSLRRYHIIELVCAETRAAELSSAVHRTIRKMADAGMGQRGGVVLADPIVVAPQDVARAVATPVHFVDSGVEQSLHRHDYVGAVAESLREFVSHGPTKATRAVSAEAVELPVTHVEYALHAHAKAVSSAVARMTTAYMAARHQLIERNVVAPVLNAAAETAAAANDEQPSTLTFVFIFGNDETDLQRMQQLSGLLSDADAVHLRRTMRASPHVGLSAAVASSHTVHITNEVVHVRDDRVSTVLGNARNCGILRAQDNTKADCAVGAWTGLLGLCRQAVDAAALLTAVELPGQQAAATRAADQVRRQQFRQAVDAAFRSAADFENVFFDVALNGRTALSTRHERFGGRVDVGGHMRPCRALDDNGGACADERPCQTATLALSLMRHVVPGSRLVGQQLIHDAVIGELVIGNGILDNMCPGGLCRMTSSALDGIMTPSMSRRLLVDTTRSAVSFFRDNVVTLPLSVLDLRQGVRTSMETGHAAAWCWVRRLRSSTLESRTGLCHPVRVPASALGVPPAVITVLRRQVQHARAAVFFPALARNHAVAVDELARAPITVPDAPYPRSVLPDVAPRLGSIDATSFMHWTADTPLITFETHAAVTHMVRVNDWHCDALAARTQRLRDTVCGLMVRRLAACPPRAVDMDLLRLLGALARRAQELVAATGADG